MTASTPTLSASTISIKTNAAAYAFDGWFPSPVGAL